MNIKALQRELKLLRQVAKAARPFLSLETMKSGAGDAFYISLDGGKTGMGSHLKKAFQRLDSMKVGKGPGKKTPTGVLIWDWKDQMDEKELNALLRSTACPQVRFVETGGDWLALVVGPAGMSYKSAQSFYTKEEKALACADEADDELTGLITAKKP